MEREIDLIVYGSYGYTGSLIVEECKRRNLKILLAGRSAEKLKAQSQVSGYSFESVSINDHRALVSLLYKAKIVLHCAGPFSSTAIPMAHACIEAGTHYLDITGEYKVFEDLKLLNEKASTRGVVLMPGTGFDVVPTDCLALHLKKRMTDADNLIMAFASVPAGVSRGTAKTALQNFGQPSLMRSNGVLVPVPNDLRKREINFGSRTMTSWCISWGDISTAFHTTGIPNIRIYLGSSKRQLRMFEWLSKLGWIFKIKWVRNSIKKRIDSGPAGPSEEILKTGKTLVWGQVTNRNGEVAQSLMETPNGYTVTYIMSVEIATRLLGYSGPGGYKTPAQMFGSELINSCQRVSLKNL